ncbi:Protein KTI12-like [Gracilariopsis chorda]|uniref:Protein KTI12-like n=1 Tax=Gracilariopsis chorda TaxID=448386 RepID=A0A2V3IQ06_9FLOR|nr:Protein KTI12-like [Gracilariopsis chorda]|eukprot:PXF44139.1 Protein KTI12-like [Gracilariopsis chorda]
MCGFPASGKSTFADSLADLLKESGKEVYLIRDGCDSVASESTVSVDKEEAAPIHNTRETLYRDSATEKKTRARLRAATERSLNVSNVVICDSLNYIKGFRYEMYCVAKTSSFRYAVVHCEASASECVQRDADRKARGEDAYGEDCTKAIIQRFEEPSAKNRWDSPLYKVDTSKEEWKVLLEAVRDMVLSQSNRLAPTMATKQPQKQGADTLGTLDRITRETEAVLIQAIQHGKGVGDQIQINGASKPVRLERKPKVSQLRNIRRSYLNLARMHPPQGCSATDLVDEYVEYVNAQLRVSQR